MMSLRRHPFERRFQRLNADDLIAATLAAITDPWLKSLPVIGSIDQLTTLTPTLENPAATHRVMGALFG